MLHEKYKPPTSRQQPSSESLALRHSLQEVAEQNKDMRPHLSKAQVYTVWWKILKCIIFADWSKILWNFFDDQGFPLTIVFHRNTVLGLPAKTAKITRLKSFVTCGTCIHVYRESYIHVSKVEPCKPVIPDQLFQSS